MSDTRARTTQTQTPSLHDGTSDPGFDSKRRSLRGTVSNPVAATSTAATTKTPSATVKMAATPAIPAATTARGAQAAASVAKSTAPIKLALRAKQDAGAPRQEPDPKRMSFSH